jgi:nucleoside-diphosphate-sugar epimerase
MKILISGGAGFIGSHLATRLLQQNHEVICVDTFLTSSENNISHLLKHKNFKFINHNILQPLPENLKADAVFHMASPASPNHHSPISYHALPMETMMANTMGTLELLKFTEKNNAKFLFASTSEIYGDPLEHPQNEEYRGNVSTTGPRSVYDEAKRFGETLTAYYWRDKKVDTRIVRIFNTYGPRMMKADMRMVVIFIQQALKNIPITIFGDGKQTRSLCYIDDTVEGLISLMFKPNTSGEVVNIGSDEERTVLEYATIIKNLVQSKSSITFSEALPEDDPRKRRPDISKAKKLLDWEPKVHLEDGLKKMIEFLKEV